MFPLFQNFHFVFTGYTYPGPTVLPEASYRSDTKSPVNAEHISGLPQGCSHYNTAAEL